MARRFCKQLYLGRSYHFEHRLERAFLNRIGPKKRDVFQVIWFDNWVKLVGLIFSFPEILVACHND